MQKKSNTIQANKSSSEMKLSCDVEKIKCGEEEWLDLVTVQQQ